MPCSDRPPLFPVSTTKMPTSLSLSLLLHFILSAVAAASAADDGTDLGGIGAWLGGGNGGGRSSPTTTTTSAYAALQAWKSAITEDPNRVLATWVGSNVCSYRGVFCSAPPTQDTAVSPSDQVVAVIDLNRANLKGVLVKELSLLTHLTALHLNSNRFAGAVPDSFADLQYLVELDLSNNLFAVSFPTAVLTIPNLAYLDLRFNRFMGGVPDELFGRDMDAIFLNNNMFDGEIPASLWSSPASVITLANNRFGGSLPATFGYTGSGLRQVLFSNNKLTGCIPEGVGFQTEMEVLDFSYNYLSGQLPSSLSCLSGIEVLNIGHNKLSGVLSDVVCSIRSLAYLTLSFNFFSGFSGQDCGRLGGRNAGFDFAGNCIRGWEMQRPQPDCAQGPGEGMSCIGNGIPSARPVACSVPLGLKYGAVVRGASARSRSALP